MTCFRFYVWIFIEVIWCRVIGIWNLFSYESLSIMYLLMVKWVDPLLRFEFNFIRSLQRLSGSISMGFPLVSALMRLGVKSTTTDEAPINSITLFVVLLCFCVVIGHLLEKSRWMTESVTALLIVSSSKLNALVLVYWITCHCFGIFGWFFYWVWFECRAFVLELLFF